MTNEQLTTYLKARPITVGCVLLAIILALAIYFRSDDLPDAEKMLDEKSSQGERINANLNNGAQLNEQLTALTTARQQIEARLIQADDLAKNQQYFYKIEADTNVKLIEIHQNPVVKAIKGPRTNYQPISFGLVVRGNYPQLLDFLRRFETGSAYNRVNSATVNSGTTERSNELTISLNLELLGQP